VASRQDLAGRLLESGHSVTHGSMRLIPPRTVLRLQWIPGLNDFAWAPAKSQNLPRRADLALRRSASDIQNRASKAG
jgi:hypothetical protein